MYSSLLRIIYKIENNNVFASIRKGFALLIPVLLIGSFALLLRSFPIEGFQWLIAHWGGGIVLTILNFLFDSTVGFMSVYLVISISHNYSNELKVENRLLQVMATIVASICFVASFGAAGGSLEFSDLGPVGVFTAIFCAVAATKLFYFLCSKMSYMHPFISSRADMDYKDSFNAILPMFLCVSVFIAINLCIQAVFKVDSLNDLITTAIVALFNGMNNGVAVGGLYVFLLNFLWAFGIHGGNALEHVAQTYLVPNDTIPNIIISKSFLDNFVLIGGCGTSICLLTALLISAKSRDNRQLSRLAAPAVLFNINEILMYGLPVVLNPVIIIPFILTPLIALLISYGATVIGFLPVVEKTVTWTTPVFFSGYMATGSWRGVILQLVVVAAGTMIYIPFVRLSEKIRQKQAKLLLGELTDIVKEQQEEGISSLLTQRHDSVGLLARNMVKRLRVDVEEGNIPLEYQPQYHSEKGIVGAEALLRWKYMGEAIYPPLVIELALEDGIFDLLTDRIIKISMEACQALNKEKAGFTISANISAGQLDNPRFIEKVLNLADKYEVRDCYCLEITEDTAVDRLKEIPYHIRRLKSAGIRTAIDDFSMGHTSLKYLQYNSFYAVKLDGGIVKEMLENPRNMEIISSIVSLGKKLDFVVLAEYVETEAIRDKLKSLGCHLYQGYLYSPSIQLEQLNRLLKDGAK